MDLSGDRSRLMHPKPAAARLAAMYANKDRGKLKVVRLYESV